MTPGRIGRTACVGLIGLEGHLVDVEVLAVSGLPAFVLVGLPDASLGESRDRVRAAFSASGLAFPVARVTANLSPAALPKSGTAFDLAIAVAVLAAHGDIAAEAPACAVHLGELGLDGRVRPVRGVLPAVAAAVRAGYSRVVVAAPNAAEARLVPGAQVQAVASLAQLAQHYGCDISAPQPAGAPIDGPRADESAPPAPTVPAAAAPRPDLADVVGQAEARFALEVAAAGGHHMLMLGAPGAGKTMLAARLPGLLPDLPDTEAVEVTAVHSVAGTFEPGGGLIRRPPFEDPHHTASPAAMVGGGSGIPRPGAVSRAHRGVLFMDEAPEFSPRVLQTLRQPLEEGHLVIQRARGVARYPARFQLVLAANPCPCGRAVGKALDCECSPSARRRYFARLSGPLLDRIDVQVEMSPVTRADLVAVDASGQGDATAVVARRVARAREVARERLDGTPWTSNAEVSGPWLRAELRRRAGGRAAWLTRDIDRGLDKGWLTLRGVDRVLRLAWTVADLAERAAPGDDDIGIALALRSRGRVDA